MTHARMHRLWLAGTLLAAAGCAHPAARPASAPAAESVAPQTAAAFAPEIARFEAEDRANPPAPGGILFVGSSSIRFWTDLASDFPGEPVLNRGFGGSTFPDLIWYAPRIVLPYRPRLIVLYEGDNDVAAGRTPRQILSDYDTFLGMVRRALPATRIVFISIKPSPIRWQLADRMRDANALVRGAIARDSLATYVDVFTPMLGADGRPRSDLYRADSLHMTRAGYAIWRTRLSPLVH